MDPHPISTTQHGASVPGPAPASGGVAAAIPLHPDPAEARAATAGVRAEFLRAFPELADGTLEGLRVDHTTRLLEMYDERCLRGFVARRLAEGKHLPVQFRFSGRLTSSAGMTTRTKVADIHDPARRPYVVYELVFSTLLLFDAFRGEARENAVGGVVCRDRLDAFLRVFEHELVHLVEFLAFESSDCRAPNFAWLVSRVFGHTVASHGLVSRRERARVELGLRVGDRVTFVAAGERLTGFIESIRRRATVRIDEPWMGAAARRYYVPIGMLARAEA